MKEKSEVSPWDVSGDVDYDKLVKEFGLQHVDEKLLERIPKPHHLFLSRGLYAFHRDFDKALDRFEKGETFALATGLKPSGEFHLGHSLSFRMTKWLQDMFNAPVFIYQPDDEALYTRPHLSEEEIAEHTYNNLLDIIAFGFDPDNTFIFTGFEYTSLYKIAGKIASKTTFNTAKGVFGESVMKNIGWSFYPAMQSAHLVMASWILDKNMMTIVPMGADQDPYEKIVRDAAPKLGIPKPGAIDSKFLPPLEGFSGKMSSSSGKESVIFMSDDEKTVKKKINKYGLTGGRDTLEEQKEKGGQPEKCVVYYWHFSVFEEDDKKLTERFKDCKSGKLLCGECKAQLIGYVNSTIKTHQEARKKAEKQVDKFRYKGKLAKKAWEFK